MIFKRKSRGKIIHPDEDIVISAVELEGGGWLIFRDDTMTNFLKRNKGVIS